MSSSTLDAALKCVLFTSKSPLSNLDDMSTPSVASLKAMCSIREKNMENKVGARTHPCFVPLVTPKGVDFSLPSLTVTIMPS